MNGLFIPKTLKEMAAELLVDSSWTEVVLEKGYVTGILGDTSWRWTGCRGFYRLESAVDVRTKGFDL